MPIHDQHDFRQWLDRRRQRELAIHDQPLDDALCTRCGQTAGDQRIIAGYCVECLAFDFGADHTIGRLGRFGQAVATTLVKCDPHATARLVVAILDRLDDALEDIEADPNP